MKRTRWQKDVLALADAMAAGCRKTRPTTGIFWANWGDGKPGACALGAAYVDSKKLSTIHDISYSDVEREFPVVGTSRGGEELGYRIIDLNDWEVMPRGSIIRWLRTLAKQPKAPRSWE